MKEKLKKLTTDLKKFHESHYGMIILVSWFVLLVCLIIKLFGGNLFELGSENSKFIQFCNYVETNKPLKMGIACLNYLITGYISLCVILNVKKLSKKHIIIFMPIMIFKSLISWYFSILAFILDIIILLGITTLLNRNIKRNIICFLLINAFMLITLIIRNVNFGLNFNLGNTLIENYLMQIDYYIMLILFYLYNTKKEKQKEDK